MHYSAHKILGKPGVKVGTAFILSFLSLGFLSGQSAWQKATGVRESDIGAVAADPGNPNLIYAGGASALYKSVNKGNSFFPILQLHGSFQKINYIYISPDSNTIYAATNDGLLVSSDQGRRWKKIFQTFDQESRVCHCVYAQGDEIFLGTQKGFFIKNLSENAWKKQDGDLMDETVYRITADQGNVYVATASDVYLLEKTEKRSLKILSLGTQEAEEAEPVSEDTDVPALQRRIRDLVSVDGKIWITADKGIFLSKDQGKSWERLPKNGLPQIPMNSLVIMPEPQTADEKVEGSAPGQEGPAIYAACSKGVFKYSQGRWEQVYSGMETNQVNSLAGDLDGNLYAATDKGVFFMAREKALLSPTSDPLPGLGNGALAGVQLTAQDYKEIQKKLESEPSIQDVQRLAVDYAEVHPNKIRQWRAQAKKRAWLPSFSVGLDSDHNLTRADSVWGTYTGGGQTYIGPDDKTIYNNLGWDVSLSWDLGDLVWNPDQTSIDSRSKLMVELRQDILDQITRLYFERRRLQLEMTAETEAQVGALQEIPDGTALAMNMERQMRIDELTALIDAFTGGEFSRRIDK